MPLDGLSFSNSGLFRIVTPMEAAVQAEQASRIQAEAAIKKTNKSEKTKPDIGNEKDKKTNYDGRENENDSDDSEKDEEDSNQKRESIKKYKVKFNRITDMVELVDQKTGLVIETISPDDLIGIISKTKEASGILIDKKI